MFKSIFCAGCQATTDHGVALDKNSEILATCAVCQRSVKFPLVNTEAQLNQLLANHEQASKGQISRSKDAADRANAEKKFDALMGG